MNFKIRSVVWSVVCTFAAVWAVMMMLRIVSTYAKECDRYNNAEIILSKKGNMKDALGNDNELFDEMIKDAHEIRSKFPLFVALENVTATTIHDAAELFRIEKDTKYIMLSVAGSMPFYLSVAFVVVVLFSLSTHGVLCNMRRAMQKQRPVEFGDYDVEYHDYHGVLGRRARILPGHPQRQGDIYYRQLPGSNSGFLELPAY